MLLGYNTNGFSSHRLCDAVAILSELGYESVAVTLEHGWLDPPDPSGAAVCVAELKPILDRFGMRATIETGSRFILDPRRKHQPTLVSRATEDRRRRIEFLRASVDVACSLGADSVSLWSGASDDDAGEDELFERLTAGLREVLRYAEGGEVRLSFEPEPGMFIDAMSRYESLASALDHPLFGLTLDVGHVYCLADGDVGAHIRRWRERLFNVHIEDMRRGLHEHLMFGDGEVDFPGVFEALREIDYRGPVHVELSRHSHDAVDVASRSIEFLQRFVPSTKR